MGKGIGLKEIAQWLMSLTLILAGVNALTRILGWAMTWLDILIIPLAMLSVLLTFYKYNEFKFKTLMNLMFFAVFIAVIMIMLAVQSMVMPQAPNFVVSLYQGFAPLLLGTVVAGWVIIGIGVVRLNETLGKKGNKKR